MLFVQGAATATIKMAHVHVWMATKARHVRGQYVLHMPAMAMADACGRTAVALPLVASAKHHSMVRIVFCSDAHVVTIRKLILWIKMVLKEMV